MGNLLYKQIDGMIREANSVLLCTDIRIDGDTIGSTLGMAHALMAMGKNIDVFSPKPLSSDLEFIPGASFIERNPEKLRSSYDLLLFFDTADSDTARMLPHEFFEKVPSVVFDHHATNPQYGTVNLIEPQAASTGDVLYRFLKSCGYTITQEGAQCLLTAICTDTNAFYTGNTTHACIEAAHELMSYGAKIQTIILNTMRNHTPELLRLWGVALSRLHHNIEHDILATAITYKDMQDYGVTSIQASLLAEFLQAVVAKEDSIMVLRETDEGSVRCSLRSNGRDISVIAKKYPNGGGHRMASGFSVDNARLVEKDGQWLIVSGSSSIDS